MANYQRKIGILTYTSNFNYGTFFQAYATLCAVRRHFPDSHVEIVNCNSKTKYLQVGYGKANLRKRHIHPRYLFAHLNKQAKYRKTQSQLLEMDAARGFISDSYIKTAEFLQAQAYDLLIVGSDTVLNFYDWNIESNELPTYWLPPSVSAKKIMLSSSVGTDLRLSTLNQATRQSLVDSVEDFAMLGVRDSITREFLEELAPQVSSRIDVIPDPTLSYALDCSHAQAYLKRKGVEPGTPMIGLDVPTTLIGVEPAIRYFKSQGYAVATWRGRSELTDYDFSDLGPLEWSGIFGRFNITLTNRFHASIFSLKNLTPVITIDYKSNRVTETMQSKASMLLDSFGIKDSNYGNAAEISDPDWVLTGMKACLENPGLPGIKSSLDRMHGEYDAYLERVHALFAT